MKKLFFAFVAAATLLSSCKKEETLKTPIEELTGQVNYTMQSMTYADADVLPIVTWQFNNTTMEGSILELHMNELETPVKNAATSTLRTNRNNQQKTLKFVATSGTTCAISFIEDNPCFAGSYNQGENGKEPSQVLLSEQVLDYHYDGGSGGWYSFSSSRLSGIYQITKTTDGFRLTRDDGKVVINLERELKD